MPHYSKLAMSVASAALSLVPCLAQRPALEIDRVANWQAPLYWQRPAPSGQDSSGRIAPGRETPQATETAQVGEAAVFVAITPCRLADTRSGSLPFGAPTLAAGETRVYPVPSGPCSLPATAVAYSLNIAVVPVGTMMRWLTAWPDGDTMPTLATLNDKAGLVTSNAAIVAAGNAGAIDIYVKDATDVILDVNGYYALPGSLPFGGSAATPALTFGGTNTGLYSAGTGEVGIAAGGSNVATVSSTGLSVPGNLDFGGMITYGGSAFLQDSAVPGSPGSDSIAVGLGAKPGTGGGNTAVGTSALSNLTSGDGNTAVGNFAGAGVGQGRDNVAVGLGALFAGNAGGTPIYFNTAIGTEALAFLAAGQSNTALGMGAGYFASGGSWNTFVGTDAGYNAASGSYNVFIANQGTTYPDTESNTIRIGDSNQSKTYISGIHGVTPSGASEVVINSAGQLGTVTSSRRFKTDIADMGDTTETLMSLRPVQFRYIAHGPRAPLYYGLIAEEVAEIAPELVGRNADGEIETVFYDKVNAMLLKQVQTQQRQIESEHAQSQSQIKQLTELVGQLESRLAGLESRAK